MASFWEPNENEISLKRFRLFVLLDGECERKRDSHWICASRCSYIFFSYVEQNRFFFHHWISFCSPLMLYYSLCLLLLFLLLLLRRCSCFTWIIYELATMKLNISFKIPREIELVLPMIADRLKAKANAWKSYNANRIRWLIHRKCIISYLFHIQMNPRAEWIK